jgi:hypothetical protein
MNISAPTGGATITTSQGSGTINDNPNPPATSFAISDASAVTEGGTLTFTVTRSGNTQGSYSVNYATASGSATSGSDFTATSGTLTFAAGGVTSQTITVATIDDSTHESAETVLVNLSGWINATVSQGSGTINDNDP